MNIEQARFNMIEQQIRPWEVLDAQVLRLLGSIKREEFVPKAQAGLAFVDMELPLVAGRSNLASSQVMLAPRVQARLLQDLSVQPTDRVLDVGTGSGFMAALLGAAAREVISLEIDADLARKAQLSLLNAGVGNVRVIAADASVDLAAQGVTDVGNLAGGFDVICISGSVAAVPESLKAMLTVGGRLMAIVGNEPMMRATRITRVAPDAFRSEVMWDTVAPRLSGFAVPSKFSF